jgi:hypothetical protein
MNRVSNLTLDIEAVLDGLYDSKIDGSLAWI